MGRYRAIYDSKGLAYEIEDGAVIYARPDIAGTLGAVAGAAPAIQGDLPDFVSPIDNTVVRGRAGLRDHCIRHNVVPSAELAGLPPKPMNGLKPITPQEREDCRRMIAEVIDSNVDYRNSRWNR